MSPKILVVDDDESNRTLLGLVLEREGYDVLLAVDGRTALDLNQETISHAFVDMHLPDMRGTAVVQAICQAHPHAFIVIATMDDNRDTIAAAYAADADMFLVKPYDIAKLVQLIPEAQRGQQWILDRLGLRLYYPSN
jgi:two-component system response regulator PilR (NtrC family)